MIPTYIGLVSVTFLRPRSVKWMSLQGFHDWDWVLIVKSWRLFTGASEVSMLPQCHNGMDECDGVYGEHPQKQVQSLPEMLCLELCAIVANLQ